MAINGYFAQMAMSISPAWLNQPGVAAGWASAAGWLISGAYLRWPLA